jgi:hypothetical protein
MDFEISQIKVFTFLFFMKKLLQNSLDKFNKSCSTLHHESIKIVFAFFRFFYDLRFYKNLQSDFTIDVSLFRIGP